MTDQAESLSAGLMSDDLQTLEELFQAAADLPPGERAAFLDSHGLSAEARARLQALLEQYERDESLGAPPGSTAPGPGEEAGSVIGRYKLLQHIGDGGFGSVWMAEQTAPVVRKVALKIIKLGMDTKQVIARFEAERQALAMMDHPNIAKVFDGGTTETGRPYFVMELVRGISITEYCDQNHLDTQDRLQLFIETCNAVQHAHQKGVIHRDIKPSNVMVTLHDGKPVTKVIDFGIAKAMHTRLTEKTLFTEYRQFIGTPVYMSPEQAEMSGLDIDTRTDIYSLGVLLYELLTGTTPFDLKTLLAEGYGEIQRIIREEDPPKPSVRVSTLGASSTAAAKQRRVEVKTLSRLLRGDLDWIVMRALEKERGRRYASASEFADDVGRHLANDPVSASPPSASYRLRKFLIKNRTAVGWASLILLALIAGILGTTLAMIEASRQRDQAIEAQRTAETQRQVAAQAQEQEALQRQLAVEAAEGQRSASEFLQKTLALTDPEVAGTPNLSVRELLQRASREVNDTFLGQPSAEAMVRSTIGHAYVSTGDHPQAEFNLRRAADLRSETKELDGEQQYRDLWALTKVCFALGRMDAMAVAHRARMAGHDFVRETQPELADLMDRFIRATDEADIDLGEVLFAQVRSQAREVLQDGDPIWEVLAGSYQHAAYSLWHSPVELRTEAFWRESLAILRRELPESHPDIAEALSQLVGVLNRGGRPEEAEELIRSSVRTLRTVFGEDNDRFAFALSMLGENLVGQGRYEEAEPLLLEAHTVLGQIQDATSFYPLDSLTRILALYDAWGRSEPAIPFRRELAERTSRAPYATVWTMSQYLFSPHAELRDALGALQAIADLYERRPAQQDQPLRDIAGILDTVLAEAERLYEPDDPAAVTLGRMLIRWSRTFEGRVLARDRDRMAVEGLRKIAPLRDELPALDPADGLVVRCEIALDEGREEEALELARETWLVIRDSYDEDSWISALSKGQIGKCLLRVGMLTEAETLLLQSHSGLSAHLGAHNADAEWVRATLVELYQTQNRPEDAARFAAQ